MLLVVVKDRVFDGPAGAVGLAFAPGMQLVKPLDKEQLADTVERFLCLILY